VQVDATLPDAALLDALRDYAQGLPYAAIAAALGTTPDAARKQIASLCDEDMQHDPTAAPYWAHIQQRRNSRHD
jgi:hypothetical protein